MNDSESFRTWNKIASVYEQKFMSLTIYDQSYDKFLEALKNGSAVLDIGCGPGNISKYLLDKRPDLDLSGIDMAPNMIALAKRNNPKGKFQVMDCKNVNVIRQKFDGIICGFAIPYLSETELGQFVADASNLLLKDAVLYVSFVDGNPEQSGIVSNSTGDRTVFYYHRERDVIDLIKANDMDLIDRFYIDYPKRDAIEIHTVLIAGKSMS